MTSKQLDRRREQSAAANAAAERSRTTVTELENRLRTNADLTRRQTEALRNAEAEAKRLKRSLKTQARDKDRLEKAHRKAVARAGKAQSRAATLDDKYGKSLLSDLINREKERDRATATTSEPETTATPEAQPAAAAAPVSPALPPVSPADDQTVPPATSDTARATAARRTAAKAASSAATTPRTRTPRKTAPVAEAPATTARRAAPRKRTP
ncbi:hypothetical protein [Actinoplanes sp. M2I2]|uniref:hypothetical protein n=1 Tax=Actinoplanes sp. M2I2 TaxID=1734444 RepID=UPI0020203EE3|nr:hypothetical protein [Actinoplanes sp. M2I2]